MRRAALLVWIGLAGWPAAAWSDGSARVAQDARRAHAAGDGAALDAAARSREADVWMVVERLLAEDAVDVASALAERVEPGQARGRLAAYITWRQTHPLPPRTWETLDRLLALREARDQAGAQRLLAEAPLELEGVAGVVYRDHEARLLTDPDAAVAAARAAAELTDSLGWPQGQRASLLTCVELGHVTRRPELTLEAGAKLLALLGAEADSATRSIVHDRMARASRALHRGEEALAHARAAHASAIGTRQRRDTLRYLLILQGQEAVTDDLRQRMLTLRGLELELGDARGVAATDVRLATVEAHLGRWASSLDRLDRALAYLERHGAPFERRGAHLQAALVALELLDAERVQRHVAAARAAGAGLGLDDLALYSLEAAAHALRDDPAAAAEAHRQVLARAEAAPAATRAAHWMSLATALSAARQLEAAEAARRKAWEALGSETDPEPRVRLLASESLVLLDAGKVGASLKAAEEASRLCEALRLPRLSGLVEMRLAEAHLRAGDAEAALSHAERAVDHVLTRSAALPERLGGQYRAELGRVFDIGVEAALQRGDLERLHGVAERARAVALRHRLGGGGEALDLLSPELRARELELRAAETEVALRYRAAVRAREAADVRRALVDLDAAREQLDRHRDLVHLRHGAGAHLVDPQVDALATIQAGLDAHEAQVHFTLALDRVLALVVTADEVRAVPLGTREALERLLAPFTPEDPTAPWVPTLATLRAALVDPLALPDDITRVTLVPLGQLERVPFAALWPTRDVTHVPSATVGRLLAARHEGPGQGTLAIGDPAGNRSLPAAAREAQRVGDATLLGAEATEGRLRTALAGRPRWRVIHFACHALVDPVHPLRSSLALASEGGDDGFFTVAEILATRVPAELVVVAACSSAQGRSFRQEGRVGFVHAFFVAGAERVLASLWDIDDRAAEAFMQQFHAALDRGASAAAAVRTAQAWMRDQPAWRHPAHWAGWQLWGPHAPRNPENR